MEEIVEKKINSLIYKACILLVISFIGVVLVIRGDLTGEKGMLYIFGDILGMGLCYNCGNDMFLCIRN